MKRDNFEEIIEQLTPGTLVIFDWWFVTKKPYPDLYNETTGTWEFTGCSYCPSKSYICPTCPGYMKFRRLGDGKEIKSCFSYPSGEDKRTPIVVVEKCLPNELFEI